MLDFCVGAECLTMDALLKKKNMHAGWGRAISREKEAKFVSVTRIHLSIHTEYTLRRKWQGGALFVIQPNCVYMEQ